MGEAGIFASHVIVGANQNWKVTLPGLEVDVHACGRIYRKLIYRRTGINGATRTRTPVWPAAAVRGLTKAPGDPFQPAVSALIGAISLSVI